MNGFEEKVIKSAQRMKLARVKGAGEESALRLIGNIQNFVGGSKSLMPQTFKAFYGKLSKLVATYNDFVERLYKSKGYSSAYDALLSNNEFKLLWFNYKKEPLELRDEFFKKRVPMAITRMIRECNGAKSEIKNLQK